MSAPPRIYDRLLRILPAEFRNEYGPEMAAVFEEQDRRAQGVARWRLWCLALTDLSTTAAIEHTRSALQDLRYAFRRLRGHPALAAVAILSLALGIGANSAIFSVLERTLLADLPFRDADRLVSIWSRPIGGDEFFLNHSADFLDWRSRASSFSRLELFTVPEKFTLAQAGAEPERVMHQSMTPGYLPMLGIAPRLGRFFTEEDARAGETTALISERYWKSRFGGASDVIGKKITLDALPQVIVGVVPSEYDAGWLSRDVDVWGTIDLSPSSDWVERKVRWLAAVGRLRDGVSVRQANAELGLIAAQLAKAYPDVNREWTTVAEPMSAAVSNQWRFVIAPLAAAVVFVLLIACANVANLLLAQAASRRREIALRAALGASRERLRRELLADGFAVAIPGGLAGIAVAWVGVRVFLFFARYFPDGIPEVERSSLSLPVLLFTVGVSMATAILTGLAPAWIASRANLSETLKDGERGTMSRSGLRQALVIGEFALAMILLTSAGLMVRTVAHLGLRVLGFRPDRVVTLQLDLAGSRYVRNAPKLEMNRRAVQPAVAQFHASLLGALRDEPGMESVGIGSAAPMAPDYTPGRSFRIRGVAASPDQVARMKCATRGYFETLGIPVRQGRTFADSDREGGPWVAVVNEAFVRRFMSGGGDVLGQSIEFSGEQERPRQIVGVVGDHRSLGWKDPDPEVYTAFAQQPVVVPGNYQSMRLRPFVLVRTNSSPEEVGRVVRAAVRRIDAALPVFDVMTLQKYIDDSAAPQRFQLWLLTLLASVAMLLAAVGIGGMLHRAVTDRAQEIGVRVAMGAGRGDVIALVLASGLKLAGWGLLAGVGGAAIANRLIASLLVGVGPMDPVALAGAAGLLLAIAAGACCGPAVRALRVNPVECLRR